MAREAILERGGLARSRFPLCQNIKDSRVTTSASSELRPQSRIGAQGCPLGGAGEFLLLAARMPQLDHPAVLTWTTLAK